MKTIEKLRVLLGIIKEKFSKKVTEEGIEIFYDGETDDLIEGVTVYDAEGNVIPDGDYTDGETIYTIEGSKVVKVTEKEKVVEVENACDDAEEKKVEAAEEVVEEKEETVEEEKVTEEEPKPVEPTTEELVKRIEEIEKVMGEMFQTIMEMKEKTNQSITKQEEIIREFSAMHHSPTVESITKDNSNKQYGEKMTMADKLNFLKNMSK